jgi:glycosyltransferase involved in cell wall biosynthesis
MPVWLQNLKNKNIVISGEVENQYDFMESKGMMLVPLLSGGGMRIKIIEGMAIGKTIISTSIGAEGIPYEHGKNILIADTADEFAACINLCVSDPELYLRIGVNARNLVLENFDTAKICQNLLSFYEQLVSLQHVKYDR